MSIIGEEELNLDEPTEETPAEPVEETLEETEESTEEAQVEESSEQQQEEEQKPKEEPQEYSKERFDGLMSSWQEDRRRMLKLEEDLATTKQPAQPEKKEEKWLGYIFDKLDERNSAKQQTELQSNLREKQEVQTAYPNLDINKVVDKAGSYGVSLITAAKILQDTQSGQKVNQTLQQADTQRKKDAGKIAGKPGVPIKPGLSKYDSKLSFEDNFEKGLKELGY